MVELLCVITDLRMRHSRVEQIVDLPFPNGNGGLLETRILIAETRAPMLVVVRIVGVPTPKVMEERIEGQRVIAKRRALQRMVDQLWYLSVPIVHEYLVEALRVITVMRVPQRMVNQGVDLALLMVVEEPVGQIVNEKRECGPSRGFVLPGEVRGHHRAHDPMGDHLWGGHRATGRHPEVHGRADHGQRGAWRPRKSSSSRGWSCHGVASCTMQSSCCGSCWMWASERNSPSPQ